MAKKINLRLYQMGGIPRYFEKQNVCVCGMMGTGKDVLFGNVIARIGRPYISNMDYGGDRVVWKPWMLDYNNTWKDLMQDTIHRYEHLFPDGWHTYVSDLAIYLPATYCNEISKLYPNISTSLPMTRQITGGWFHGNAQVPEKIFDKVRCHFDIWFVCQSCVFPFKNSRIPFLRNLVIQRVIEYDRYQSAVDRVPVFPLRKPFFNSNRIQLYEIQKANYLISHGKVKSHFLIYLNKSKHDTRAFKAKFSNASL